MSGFPDIDNSRKKLSQKIQQLLAKSDGDTSWVFFYLHENIILQDKNSDGKALENITINACDVVQKYLHWKMDETACFFLHSVVHIVLEHMAPITCWTHFEVCVCSKIGELFASGASFGCDYEGG